ncbi:MAG: 1,2-phenylacetyl-CoA epoxidase, subunit C, partial [uncultured Solirubrobacteraceae bacterium]
RDAARARRRLHGARRPPGPAQRAPRPHARGDADRRTLAPGGPVV